jgi:hypothetical protein
MLRVVSCTMGRQTIIAMLCTQYVLLYTAKKMNVTHAVQVVVVLAWFKRGYSYSVSRDLANRGLPCKNPRTNNPAERGRTPQATTSNSIFQASYSTKETDSSLKSSPGYIYAPSPLRIIHILSIYIYISIKRTRTCQILK